MGRIIAAKFARVESRAGIQAKSAPLGERGIKEAGELGLCIADILADRRAYVETATWKRAAETGEIVLAHLVANGLSADQDSVTPSFQWVSKKVNRADRARTAAISRARELDDVDLVIVTHQVIAKAIGVSGLEEEPVPSPTGDFIYVVSEDEVATAEIPPFG